MTGAAKPDLCKTKLLGMLAVTAQTVRRVNHIQGLRKPRFAKAIDRVTFIWARVTGQTLHGCDRLIAEIHGVGPQAQKVAQIGLDLLAGRAFGLLVAGPTRNPLMIRQQRTMGQFRHRVGRLKREHRQNQKRHSPQERQFADHPRARQTKISHCKAQSKINCEKLATNTYQIINICKKGPPNGSPFRKNVASD
jgi:Sec-independent protein translocase protein TatA